MTKSFAFVLAASVLSAPALAQKIHAGSATGSYTNDFCPQVQNTLADQYFEHQCTTSQGTGDNVEKVLTNKEDVGLGQFDIVAAQAIANPDKLALVDPKLGLECLYAVTTNSNLTRLKGLSPRMPIALPPEKSGSSATFRFLQSLDEGLADLRRIKHYGSALDAVNAVVAGDAALAFFVQFPKTSNAVFKAINDAKLNFVPVINRAILRHEVAGLKVYQPQEVVVTPAGLLAKLTGKQPAKIDTTCTPVLLFTGHPSLFPEGSTARQDQEELIQLLAKTPRPESGDWKDVFKNAVAIGKEKFDELVQKYGN